MTIEKARELLGKKAEKMTDSEVERIISDLHTLAEIVIESYIVNKSKNG